jgi:uncharacterized protein YlxP (DUF503 family)
MTIGLLKIALHIPACNSLKEKRRVLLRLRDLLRNRFNVSMAEVDGQDKWQKLVLAIVSVGTEKAMVDRGLAKIVDLIRDFDAVELLDYELEWL